MGGFLIGRGRGRGTVCEEGGEVGGGGSGRERRVEVASTCIISLPYHVLVSIIRMRANENMRKAIN